MAQKPDRGELKFRLVFSLAGLGLLIAALALRGIPRGPALFEVIGVAGLFFGLSAAHAAWRLYQTKDDT